MILHRLTEHYRALYRAGNAPDVGWATVAVNLGILLDADGTVLNLMPRNQTVRMGKKDVIKPQVFAVPAQPVRTSGVSANFLCDNAAYLLGVDSKGTIKKTLQKWEAAKEYHLRLLDGVDSPFARAICAYFKRWDVAAAAEHPLVLREADLIAAGRNLVFMMDGDQYAHKDPAIAHMWDALYQSNLSTYVRRCVISGETEPIARLHDKVKNVPDAQAAGANLVSINADAFSSYGLTDSMPGAPIGEYSAFAHVTALNILLADFEHRLDLGNTRLVYWAGEANEKAADLMTFAIMPPPESDLHVLETMFQRIEQGLSVEDVPLTQPFYVLGLRPNAARIAVALFLESTFGGILQSIHAHYKRLEIVRPAYDKTEYLSPRALMDALINPNSKDKKPNPQIMVGLMRTILMGGKYPYALYENVLMRLRAEQGKDKISRTRAALVKACLLTHLPENERKCITVSLNLESRNKPYLLGRLFSVLEATQTAENKDLNITIKDRFFNSASANPNVVFPQILKLFQAHSKKLKRSNTGLAISYDQQVQEILSQLDAEEDPFPKSLSLNDQGLFILGYYQQTQARFTKKKED